MVKAVLFFLLIMVAIAMVGNAMFPGSVGRKLRKKLGVKPPPVCRGCGRYMIGSTGCDCKKGG
ncbi:hypothetical protein [Cypionkella sp.]|jgi:hypothetical protein|uniref:hypothetical protein n=1 Tax=Cypionkella sp. TaxID=2811411 RepID=UPI002774C950|nr:hypothetical protein [Cypionkella sp.]